MGNYNKVMILGRLTRDVELRYTPSGTPVADISVANSRRTGGKDGQESREITTYIDVTIWRRQAETAHQYLAKGSEVFIEGRLELESWEDKTTGQKRSKLKVVCENMQFVGAQRHARHAQQAEPAPAPENQAPPQEESQDDIPF